MFAVYSQNISLVARKSPCGHHRLLRGSSILKPALTERLSCTRQRNSLPPVGRCSSTYRTSRLQRSPQQKMPHGVHPMTKAITTSQCVSSAVRRASTATDCGYLPVRCGQKRAMVSLLLPGYLMPILRTPAVTWLQSSCGRRSIVPLDMLALVRANLASMAAFARRRSPAIFDQNWRFLALGGRSATSGV